MPIKTTIFSPGTGDSAGVAGKGFVVDVALDAATAHDNAALLGQPRFLAPTSPLFTPGHNPAIPGLIVTLSTATKPLNLANLFQEVGVASVKGGAKELWATWFVGKPLFGVNVDSTLTVAVVKGTAPDVVPPHLAGLTLLSNAATVTFHIAGAPRDAAAPARTIADLHTLTAVSSTIDRITGDTAPYGLALVPATVPATVTTPEGPRAAVAQPGDLLVSNVANAAGTMGAGTTVELIRPTATGVYSQTYFSRASAPIALAVSNLGATWIANFGMTGRGPTSNLQVINPLGTLFATPSDPTAGVVRTNLFAGPWGQAYNDFGLGNTLAHGPAFFSANARSGEIERVSHFKPPYFDRTSTATVIGLGFGTHGSTITSTVGPQGMVLDPKTDTLYVADAARNRIAAIAHASTTPFSAGRGTTVLQGGPLNQPAGLALNPLTGDLLVVNQGDNTLVELRPTQGAGMTGGTGTGGDTAPAVIVGVRQLDPTSVNPHTGAGSALFGIVATTNAHGGLIVYYTNDNTNTLNQLSQ
ncbi:MAG: hypothetical protein NVSMB65_12720 [Chloroflexota bacterium]